jgi:hypothetical protein
MACQLVEQEPRWAEEETDLIVGVANPGDHALDRIHRTHRQGAAVAAMDDEVCDIPPGAELTDLAMAEHEVGWTEELEIVHGLHHRHAGAA